MLLERRHRGSAARALAVNPHGSDDDELEAREANATVYGIGLHTMRLLLKPRELVESNDSDK